MATQWHKLVHRFVLLRNVACNAMNITLRNYCEMLLCWWAAIYVSFIVVFLLSHNDI